MQNRQAILSRNYFLPHCLEKDKELVQFYLSASGRPAFKDDTIKKVEWRFWIKIEDTLIVFEYRVLRTRDGSILKQVDGKFSVQNSLWREKLLPSPTQSNCRRLKIAKRKAHSIDMAQSEDKSPLFLLYDRELVEWLSLILGNEKKYQKFIVYL